MNVIGQRRGKDKLIGGGEGRRKKEERDGGEVQNFSKLN